MSKHTPGPWEWDSNPCNYDQHNEAPWLWQAPWNTNESQRILQGSIKCGNEADARLIAAAPDLLKALILAASHMHTLTTPRAKADYSLIRAAIAKATGETQ